MKNLGLFAASALALFLFASPAHAQTVVGPDPLGGVSAGVGGPGGVVSGDVGISGAGGTAQGPLGGAAGSVGPNGAQGVIDGPLGGLAGSAGPEGTGALPLPGGPFAGALDLPALASARFGGQKSTKPAFDSFTLSRGTPMGGATTFSVDSDGNYKIETSGGMAKFIRIDAQGKLTADELSAVAKAFRSMTRAKPPEQLPSDPSIMGTTPLDVSWTDAQGSHSVHGLTSMDNGLTGADKAAWSKVKALVEEVGTLETHLESKAQDPAAKDGSKDAPSLNEIATKAAADAAAKAGTSVEGGVPDAIKNRGQVEKQAPVTGMGQLLEDRVDAGSGKDAAKGEK